jgi:HemY protein
LGRAELAAREFVRARTELAPLIEGRSSARVYLLMAEIEEAENGMTGRAREWLARAAHAPRDPAWIADGVISPQWAPVEPESGRIGAFAWGHPPELPGTIAHAPTISAPAPAFQPEAEAVARPVELAKLAPPQAANAGDTAHPGEDTPKPSTAKAARNHGNSGTPVPGSEAVAFPLARAPDDPGADRPIGKGLWRRFTG